MNYWKKKRFNKGVITFSLSFAILLTSFGLGSLSLKKNNDKVKIIDKDSTSISTIDNNNYLVAFNDLEVSSKNIDKYSGTLAKNCIKLVELSEVLNTESKTKIKKTIKDFDMDELFYLCDVTDSIDLYVAIKNKEYDNLYYIVNGWLLNRGYSVMADYAESSIYNFIDDNEKLKLDFDVYDANTGNCILDDCFANNDYSLELITTNNKHYKFEGSDILNAYITMKYEGSISNTGNINYNKSRNSYLKKAYSIIGEFNYKQNENDYVVNNMHKNYIDNTYNYVVRKNDTLSDIICRFNTDKDELVSLNKKVDLDNLKVGDIVVVPFNSDINNNIEKYTVVSGDTVIRIINKYGVSMTDFENANPQIANFDRILVGEELNIPITENKVYTTETIGVIDVDDIVLNEEEKGTNEIIVCDNSISESIARRGYATGIDISSYQNKIDFNKISKNENIDFVIIRENLLGYKTRDTKQDSNAENNYKELMERNIPVCFYVWLGLQDEDKIENQANRIVNELTELQDKYGYTDLPLLFIDYENITDSKGNVRYDMTSDPYTAGHSMLKAISIFENAGYRVGIYAGTNDKTKLDNTVPEIKNYDTWLACYHKNYERGLENITDENQLSVVSSRYNDSYDMLQSTSHGLVDGIESGYVDLNIMYVDYPKVLKENNKGLTLRR